MRRVGRAGTLLGAVAAFGATLGAGCGNGEGAGGGTGGAGATTTSTTSTTATGGAGPACSGGPGTALPCSTPLGERALATSVATTVGGFGAVFMAAEPGGCAKAAWSDGGAVHVTPIDAAGQRFADDVTTVGTEIRGLVAHDDGAAVLVVRGDEMVLVRLASTGAALFENVVVGGNAHQTEGDRWIDGWPHEGRLAWSGASYAAYFGQTGNWGAQGNHQGDHLATFDAAGAAQSEGWDWGCSHSLDVRIAHDGVRYGPVCLADCYPGKGIYFAHQEALVSDEPSGDCAGGSSAALGGLVPVSGGFWLTYVSTEGRPTHDVALVHIDDAADVAAPSWLTSTDAVEESGAHLVRYGTGMLAAWSAGGQTFLLALDANGGVVEGPTPLATTLPQGSDLVAYPGGDVGWAYADGGGLSVVRLARCE